LYNDLTVRLLNLTSRKIDGDHGMMYKLGQEMCLALILINSKLCRRLQIKKSCPLTSSIFKWNHSRYEWVFFRLRPSSYLWHWLLNFVRHMILYIALIWSRICKFIMHWFYLRSQATLT